MKSLYESLLTGKYKMPKAKVQPRSKKELQQLIDEHIKEIKPRPGQEVDLNWIDISLVDDLSYLFNSVKYIPIINTWKIDHVYNFQFMFWNNRCIKKSPLPVLQEKLLMDACYAGMFEDCKNLEEPPELPARGLTVNCYSDMFRGCWVLKTAPELPATTLVRNCYNCMFMHCKSLREKAKTPKNAPVDRDDYTYNMYYGCLKINEEEK